MKHQQDELFLLEKAREGNAQAFDQLVKLHQTRVYSVALRLLGNRAEAEDVLQETFISLYKNLNRFRGSSSLATYLFRLATNFSLMKIRNSRRRGNDSKHLSLSEIEEHPDAAASPLESLLNNELRSILDKQLQKLPDIERAVVVLRDIEGLDGNQVSKILGLSLPAMKSKLHRSREYLRKNLSVYLKEN
jgi:RNA polymerase sigma-70 factor (ECF subfamily)